MLPALPWSNPIEQHENFGSSDSVLELTICSIDLSRRVVTRVDGTKSLTQLEHDFLSALLSAGEKGVSTESLQRSVWGHQVITPTRAVDKLVARLRRKIEFNPSQPDHVVAVWGWGYRLELPGPTVQWNARTVDAATNVPSSASAKDNETTGCPSRSGSIRLFQSTQT